MPGDEVRHQLERLRLYGDIEGGARLVGDQQLRLVGERHGDQDALVHAARQLEGIGSKHALRVVDGDFA